MSQGEVPVYRVEVNGVNPSKEKNAPRAKKTKAERGQSESSQKPQARQKASFDQIIFRDWCKSCGLCAAFCPKKVVRLDETGAPVIEQPDECIGCRFCELHCPDFAITIKERDKDFRRNE